MRAIAAMGRSYEYEEQRIATTKKAARRRPIRKRRVQSP